MLKVTLTTALLLLSCNTSAVIQGKDDRYFVYNNDDSHAKRTVLLTAHNPSRESDEVQNCTGTYIAAHYILTSAHCIYDTDVKNFNYRIYASPSLQKDSEKAWSNVFIETVYYMPEYLPAVDHYHALEKKKYDIAILKVHKPKHQDNNAVGWNPPYFLSDKHEINNNGTAKEIDVFIHSYPDDRKEKLVVQDNCTMKRYDEFIYEHNCDTVKGSSGAAMKARHPKWSPREEDPNDNFYIMGIHSGIDEHDNNYATRINKARWKTIKQISEGVSLVDLDHPNIFVPLDIQVQRFNEIEFINECNVEVQYALRYKDLYEGWVTLGFYNLKPGDYHTANIKTTQNEYEIWAMDKNGNEKVSGRTKNNYSIHGHDLAFTKYYMNPDKDTDFNHRFCK